MSGLKTHSSLEAETANIRKLKFETVDMDFAPCETS